MTKILISALVATAFLASPVLAAKKPAAHVSHASGKGCKGEFMYSKGGKCMDSRNKTA